MTRPHWFALPVPILRRARTHGWVAAWIVLLLTSGCTRTSTESAPTSPSGSRCEVSVSNSLEAAPASGGSGTLNVVTDRDCTWAASSQVSWVTFISGASGQGNGTATYRVAANTDTAPRQASLNVNDRPVALVQAAACRYTVTPPSFDVASAGGTVEVRVEAGEACEWGSASDVDWIRVRGSGTGPGVATVEVLANGGGPRTARLVVAGQSITVNQSAAAVAPCTYSLDPIGQTVPQSGGTVDVAVNTGPACAWTASANVPWIAITRNPSGTGPSSISLSVSSNPGAARSGTATIAGMTFTVTQSPVACAYALGATSTTLAAGGGTGSVAVNTANTCSWSATSNVPWVTLTGSASGTGNGSVAFTVAANAGAARNGTLTVAGLTFTITQAAAVPVCAYSLTPAARTVDSNATTGTFTVSTTAGCAWTAVVTPTSEWLTVTAGASGSGNGTVTYRVDRNRGATRTATVQVMTQGFRLTQTN